MGFTPRKLGEKPIHSCPIISLSEQVQLNKETIFSKCEFSDKLRIFAPIWNSAFNFPKKETKNAKFLTLKSLSENMCNLQKAMKITEVANAEKKILRVLKILATFLIRQRKKGQAF